MECVLYTDDALSITDKELLYKSKNCGWEPRFGQPSYVKGSVMMLTPTWLLLVPPEFTNAEGDLENSHSNYKELLGSLSFLVKNLCNKQDGGKVQVTSKMQLCQA